MANEIERQTKADANEKILPPHITRAVQDVLSSGPEQLDAIAEKLDDIAALLRGMRDIQRLQMLYQEHVHSDALTLNKARESLGRGPIEPAPRASTP